MCKFGAFEYLFTCLVFQCFFYCFSIDFWRFSTLKNKHFVRDVFQISKIIRVQSFYRFGTDFVIDFRAKFGTFWGSASMRWECFFFMWFSMRFWTLFGAPNEPKNGPMIFGQATIITYCAPDGCFDSFLTPPGRHFGRFGSLFLVDFGSRHSLLLNILMKVCTELEVEECIWQATYCALHICSKLELCSTDRFPFCHFLSVALRTAFISIITC